MKAYYQWLHKNNEIENGLYETDYPEHMLNVSAYWRFVSELAVEFAQTTRWQAENTVRTSSDFGAVASLGLHYDPRFAKNVRLSFLVNNLWSTDFQSIPGLKPPPDDPVRPELPWVGKDHSSQRRRVRRALQVNKLRVLCASARATFFIERYLRWVLKKDH